MKITIFFHTPPAVDGVDAPVRGPHRNIATISTEKLERCATRRYPNPKVKKFDDTFTRFDTIHERD